MRLLVDIGNSRGKWALLDKVTLHSHSSAELAHLVESLNEYLAAKASDVSQVVVSNVAGAAVQRALTQIIVERVGGEPVYLQSTQEFCGIRNAYSVPEKLGIDRLVAMVGALELHAGPLCVVSVGTAMTIDVVDGASQHLGGLIVPGPRLMVSSLLANTSEIRARAIDGERNAQLLATDTLGAIEQGAEQALGALIDRVVTKLERQLNAAVTLVLTGGAEGLVRDLVSAPLVVVPDLTLRGLAVAARHVFPGAPSASGPRV